MQRPSARQTYTQFTKVIPQQRKRQSQKFLLNKPDQVPAILNNLSTQLPQLKNCKFLLYKNLPIKAELEKIRQFIIKNSNNTLGKESQLFFYVKGSLMNENKLTQEVYEQWQDKLEDGWLVISYNKEATF